VSAADRRALERHQTLRHAVQWSYDLLDDDEKALLDRYSVFVVGFYLESACAVAGFGDADECAVLDLLEALVRKSLLVADQSAGRTRYSMLETIRQFAEDKLVGRGEATQLRTAHARHFAHREGDILALWDSPRRREACEWLTAELRICAPPSAGRPTKTGRPHAGCDGRFRRDQRLLRDRDGAADEPILACCQGAERR
jgi:predicted ATPase